MGVTAKQAVLVREVGSTGSLAAVSVAAGPGCDGSPIMPDRREETRPMVPVIRKPVAVRQSRLAALFVAALREEVEAKRAGYGRAP